MTEFLVLGPIEIRLATRTVTPGGAMLQTLLAALLVSDNRTVTVEALEQELWGTTPPAKKENALQAQISRLRRTLARLEPGRGHNRVSTSCAGYQFAVSPTELDVASFLKTVETVRTRVTGNLDQDIAELRAALDLWRGPVFGGITGDVLCRTATAKFEEARINALELLYDLELEAGRYAAAIPELTQRVAENPLREQFCGLLMVALYRSGRQIDALNVFRRLRHQLGEELGVDPSPTLRRYERAILEHDPLLLQEKRQLISTTNASRSAS
jgi:SARP family transcriptional regulator, regulator of embCAB operon